MRLSAGQGLYPSIVLSSACFLLLIIASITQHDTVVELGQGVASKAVNSYHRVADKIIPSKEEEDINDPSYLSPEWKWAAHISIVYTVR